MSNAPPMGFTTSPRVPRTMPPILAAINALRNHETMTNAPMPEFATDGTPVHRPHSPLVRTHTVSFRDAVGSDVAHITTLYRRLISETLPKADSTVIDKVTSDILPAPGFASVNVLAELEGARAPHPTIGFARALWMGPLPEHRHAAQGSAYVDEIYVLPEHRRLGIGQGLMRCLLAALRKRGVGHVWTYPKERPSEALCESFGAKRSEAMTLAL